MLRHPVVITSIEEDFKRIGLLKESAATEPTPEPEFEPEIDEDDDEIDEEEEEELEALAQEWDEVERFTLTDEEMSVLESMGTVTTSRVEDESLDDLDEDDEDLDEDGFLLNSLDDEFFEDLELDAEELEDKYGESYEERLDAMREMMQALEGRRRAAGKRGMVRTKRMSSKDKAAARRYYRSHKAKIGKQRRRRAKSSHGRRLAKFAKSLENQEESLSGILEHVGELVSELEESVDTDTAQAGFANIALLSEMLVHVFESLEDEDMDEVIEDYTELAHSAAEIVEFLHDNEEELDEDAMSESYRECLSDLEEGLSLYQALIEDEDSEGNDEDAS
jgi:hypothetical protein